ncbi:MAG: YbhB/YbcL family Raf kinase inhibitor-like protein [Gammaproteobacteria bacterium]|nr:YbhB/YbcL family Raf kinase inhibitor-like protein [Gammaproteobacteria bacterium]
MNFALSDMQLSSPAFSAGGQIPTRHSGEGEDTSPQLQWTNAPDGTRSFAVICHDPDAPVVSSGGYGFVHWVHYNVPGTATGLPEGTEENTTGPSDFGKPGYGGPMPPNGHGTHNYFFWVLALGREPDLEPGLTLRQLLETIESDVIGMNRLLGTYERK